MAAGAALATTLAAAGAVAVLAIQPQAPGTAAAAAAVAVRRAPADPVVAGGLRVAARGATTVDLRWLDPNAGAARYLVLVDPDRRGAGPVPADGVTGHVVSGLTPRTSYCFRVATGDADVALVTPPVCTRTR